MKFYIDNKTKLLESNAYTTQNEYRKRDILAQFEDYQEIKEFYPCRFEITLRNGEHNFSILLNDKYNIYITKDNYRKTYSIGALKSYSMVDYNLQNRLTNENELIKPNNFKVLNFKIVKKWVDYRKAQAKIFQVEQNRKEKIVSDFKVRVDTLAMKEGIKHIQCRDLNTGRLEGENFTFTYEISSSGYINEKITFNNYKRDLEEFERLTSL